MLKMETDYHAIAGTSIYWSYEKFLEHYKKYTHIVFVYTFPWRWPYLNEDYFPKGSHFMLYNSTKSINSMNMSEKSKKILIGLEESVPYMLKTELLTFIAKSVTAKVNKICKENNIKLVNVFVETNSNPVSEIYDEEDLLFSSIEDLTYVSRTEKFIVDGEEVDMHTLCQQNKPDCRYCHLLEPNNQTLANHVFTLFKKEKITRLKATDMKDWVFSDRKTELKYNASNI